MMAEDRTSWRQWRIEELLVEGIIPLLFPALPTLISLFHPLFHLPLCPVIPSCRPYSSVLVRYLAMCMRRPLVPLPLK